MATDNALCVYDFTWDCSKITREQLIEWLFEQCKKWTFQQEKGNKTGYIHYQGRMSLKTKKRLNTLIGLLKYPGCHLSPTSNENRNNDFYVLKEDTKLDGPWSDSTAINKLSIPRDVKKMVNLYKWQEKLVEFLGIEEDRIVDVIVDTKGNQGKTSFIKYCRVHNLARMLPMFNDYKELMEVACDVGPHKGYCIDMPRAINKEKLYQLWSGIETLKSGIAFDRRYKYKEIIFDPPRVLVFTNKIPEIDLLSKDRWRLWTIKDGDLEALKL